MVKLTSEEQEYMTTHCRFLPSVYWEWLSSFRFEVVNLYKSVSKIVFITMIFRFSCGKYKQEKGLSQLLKCQTILFSYFKFKLFQF